MSRAKADLAAIELCQGRLQKNMQKTCDTRVSGLGFRVQGIHRYEKSYTYSNIIPKL